MIGRHTILIQNRAVRFSFDVERNISIIRGDSATGKTTLVGMVADYQAQGKASGVELVCDKKCVAMLGLGATWKIFLESVRDCIVFIDEGERYVTSKDFAHYIKKTDNYYVIVSRNNLYEIPYSVDAVYEIKKSGKYGKLKKTYNCLRKMYSYSTEQPQNTKLKDHKMVIVEDSNAGYQFFDKVCGNYGINCIAAGGNGNILKTAEECENNILIVADGAAFGPQMANIYGLASRRNYNLFLPESFEWLILNSNIIKKKEIKMVLENPCAYIRSEDFFTWEQFFTAFLVDISKNKEYRYNKRKINDYYLSSRSISQILGGFFSDL